MPGGGGAGQAAGRPLCGLRPGAAGHDCPRLFHLLHLLFVLRAGHLRLLLFHRPERRPDLGADLLSAHPGVPVCRGPPVFRPLGAGRHLVVHCGGGGDGGGGDAGLSGGQEKKVWISVTGRPSPLAIPGGV